MTHGDVIKTIRDNDLFFKEFGTNGPNGVNAQFLADKDSGNGPEDAKEINMEMA